MRTYFLEWTRIAPATEAFQIGQSPSDDLLGPRLVKAHHSNGPVGAVEAEGYEVAGSRIQLIDGGKYLKRDLQ